MPSGEQLRDDWRRAETRCSKLSSNKQHRLVQAAHILLQSFPAATGFRFRALPTACAIVEATRAASATAAERYEANASGKRSGNLARHVQGQSRLSDATRTGQRDQPHFFAAQELAQSSLLPVRVQ